jgi:hypothetical protein
MPIVSRSPFAPVEFHRFTGEQNLDFQAPRPALPARKSSTGVLPSRLLERSSPLMGAPKGSIVVNTALASSGRRFNGVPYLLKEQASVARLLTGFEPR